MRTITTTLNLIELQEIENGLKKQVALKQRDLDEGYVSRLNYANHVVKKYELKKAKQTLEKIQGLQDELVNQDQKITLAEGWTNFDEFESALTPKARMLFDKICKEHDHEGIDFDRMKILQEECSQCGLTFDYDLDGSIFDWTVKK